jgi:hypothetical protein
MPGVGRSSGPSRQQGFGGPGDRCRKLFELEAEAKAAGLGAGERLELRMEKAEPTLKVSRSELNRPERRRSHSALWAKHAITPWAAGFG